jgi:cytidine deaminase
MFIVGGRGRSVATATTMRRYFSATGAPFAPMSYGENHYEANATSKPNTNHTIHAEENAIRKLPPLDRNKKKLKKIDLLVIRANKTNMGNSKPCIHCILKLKDLPSRGYVLNRIFFSTNTGVIVMCRLDDLLAEEAPHMSSFYRGTGFQLKV